MTDAGFFRGTSMTQDNRFMDKKKKLMKTMKFAEGLERKVDIKKINLDAIKPWITKRLTALLSVEDDVVIDFVVNTLEDPNGVNGKEMQINLTGFLNEKNARTFMRELWDILHAAANNDTAAMIAAVAPASMVPKKAIDEKKEREEKQQKYMADFMTALAKRRESQKEDNNKALKEQSRKLCVKDLPRDTTEKCLVAYFSKWGTIVECSVDALPGPGLPSGSIVYSDGEMVDAALNTWPHELRGKVVDVSRAMAQGGDAKPGVSDAFRKGAGSDVTRGGGAEAGARRRAGRDSLSAAAEYRDSWEAAPAAAPRDSLHKHWDDGKQRNRSRSPAQKASHSHSRSWSSSSSRSQSRSPSPKRRKSRFKKPSESRSRSPSPKSKKSRFQKPRASTKSRSRSRSPDHSHSHHRSRSGSRSNHRRGSSTSTSPQPQPSQSNDYARGSASTSQSISQSGSRQDSKDWRGSKTSISPQPSYSRDYTKESASTSYGAYSTLKQSGSQSGSRQNSNHRYGNRESTSPQSSSVRQPSSTSHDKYSALMQSSLSDQSSMRKPDSSSSLIHF